MKGNSDMYCLDTYILVEINNGDPKFMSFLEKDAVITEPTLAEFYGVLYRKYGEETAKYWYKKLKSLSVPVNLDTFIKAVIFRIDNKFRNFSVFDCIGYIYAQEHSMHFVTGDKEFKDMMGVVFTS